MTEIKWQDPPPDGRGVAPGKYDLIAVALRERPGEWAMVAERVTGSMVTHVRKRYTPLGIETISRKRPEYERGRVDVYARYVGEAAS